MNEAEPGSTFRGLPLTPEQDSEIKHYIHVRQRCGAPWDTPELRAMLADMLNPPEMGDEDSGSLHDSMSSAQFAASDEQDFDMDDPLSPS